MQKILKIGLPVLLFGSLWGALELFGVDLFRYLDVPNKTAWIFAIALIVMIVSKKISDFPISVILMAVIASLFKTISANFYACQVAAVIINGVLFDLSYSMLRNKLASSVAMRSVWSFALAIVSFGLFAFTAAFVIREVHWLERGWPGIIDFTVTSGLIAAIASVITANLGFWMAKRLHVFISADRSPAYSASIKFISIIIIAGIWIYGQIYKI